MEKMIVDLKEGKLKPNTLLFYDGKQVISITKEDLIKPFVDEIRQLRCEVGVLNQKLEMHQENRSNKFKEFVKIFKGEKV